MAVDLARWSVWRVLLIAFAWLVGVPGAFILYIRWKLYSSMERGPGGGLSLSALASTTWKFWSGCSHP